MQIDTTAIARLLTLVHFQLDKDTLHNFVGKDIQLVLSSRKSSLVFACNELMREPSAAQAEIVEINAIYLASAALYAALHANDKA